MFKLFLIDLILFLLFRYYQPMCEPCLYNIDCPPCLSKEQYFIIYFGIAINTIFAIFWLFKRIKRKTIEWEFFCRHNLSIGILFLLFFVTKSGKSQIWNRIIVVSSVLYFGIIVTYYWKFKRYEFHIRTIALFCNKGQQRTFW